MVLPFVALTMVVLVGASALVIDVSNGRRIKEDLVTATDASALAAAYDFATENPGAACGTATSYLTENEPTALLVGCDGVPDPVSGRVAVTATVNANTFLASVLGIDGIDVTTSSVAAWGSPAAVGRFRPLTLCIETPGLHDLLEDDGPDPQQLRIDWAKDDPNDCGATTPGNWGEVHLDDNFSHSSSNMITWLTDGYDELIRLGAEGGGTCPGPPACLRGSINNHWFSSSIRAVLNGLVASGEYFLVPIYDFALVTGSGGGADFHVVGVIRARLDSYDVSPPSSTWFFQLTVEPDLISGACCGDPETSAGNRVLALCGLDPAEIAACP